MPFFYLKFVPGGFTSTNGKSSVLPLSDLGGKIVERFSSKKECDRHIASFCKNGKHPFEAMEQHYSAN